MEKKIEGASSYHVPPAPAGQVRPTRTLWHAPADFGGGGAEGGSPVDPISAQLGSLAIRLLVILVLDPSIRPVSMSWSLGTAAAPALYAVT